MFDHVNMGTGCAWVSNCWAGACYITTKKDPAIAQEHNFKCILDRKAPMHARQKGTQRSNVKGGCNMIRQHCRQQHMQMSLDVCAEICHPQITASCTASSGVCIDIDKGVANLVWDVKNGFSPLRVDARPGNGQK